MPVDLHLLCSTQWIQEKARVAVLGASGYTGAEVVRLGALHPNIAITALTGEKQAGKVSQSHDAVCLHTDKLL
eukprot:scaffold98965_cov14-Tisochrysis_lutea.AAC.1